MSIAIEPVRTRKQKREFIRLPYRLYRASENWVAPLIVGQKSLFNTKKHPFYKHASIEMFLARDGAKAVGRIAAIIDDNFVRAQDERCGYFGFFECDVSDGHDSAALTARSLLGCARTWLRERGMESMIGPMNPSANYECGMLVEGFDMPPVIMMPYNPPQYPRLMDECGLEKGRDLFSYHFHSDSIPDKIYRFVERCKKRGYAIRPIDMKNYRREVQALLKVYNNAWQKNWGYSPMSDEEFFEMAGEMKRIAVPSLIPIVEYKGEIAGFALSLPDINTILRRMNGRLLPFGIFKLLLGMSKIASTRTLILGVLSEHRRRGLDAMLMARSFDETSKVWNGAPEADFGWVLEDNEVTNNMLLSLGGRRYKRFRIYRDYLK